MKAFSYVVDHDTGYAPNPYFGFCTLCRCKFQKRGAPRKNIVEKAEEGDWVIGTGGASKKSAGHGKLVYAMRVDKKLTREDYFSDSRFAQKKPVRTSTSTYKQTRGDNERPCDDFERKQFALVSSHFYYFGANAIDIREFKLEKNSRGFHYIDPAEFCRFVEWLQRTYKPGTHGDPSYKESVDKLIGRKRCKLSC